MGNRISGRTSCDEYAVGGEYSSNQTIGWVLTFGFWLCFLVGMIQMMDTGQGNWWLVAGAPFWLAANYKIKKQTGESLL